MESVCTIGFDDGYRDNIDHALPLLKKYGCPASFYVVTDCIDKQVAYVDVSGRLSPTQHSREQRTGGVGKFAEWPSRSRPRERASEARLRTAF